MWVWLKGAFPFFIMAETSSTVETKSSRKNRKKRSKNPVEVEIISDVPEPIVIIDPIAQLKQQIEEAKSTKDHKKAQKLREQLWALQDTTTTGTTGPGAPEVDFSLVQIPPSVSQDLPTSPISSSLSETPADKSLRKLEKKLKAIEELKVKRDRGEKLENNQLAKIAMENEIKQEIKTVKEVLQMIQ